MNFKKKILVIILSLQIAIQYDSMAQTFGRINFDVNQNGKKLKYPFVGGLNCPQFSEADFNKDGLVDLFVFDRIGNQISTFLNNGKDDYTFAPEYASHFPPLKDWALLRDFNGDGAMDIFSYPDNGIVDGIIVYQGYYDANTLKFKRFNFYGYQHNVITWIPPSNTLPVNLYVSGQDIPDFNDVDGDGDLDILTFADGGGKLDWYKNTSIEKGFGKDSLKFVLQDDCWGRFYETGLTKSLLLSTQANKCANFRGNDKSDRNALHAGSTVLSYDADNDGDKEILLGDISFNNINLGINGGTKTAAFVTSQVSNFPAEATVPVELSIFPASFMLDVNFDGKKDYIASPNAPNSSEDQNTAWYYENTGTSQVPKFSFRQKNFLSDQMLDFGSYTIPTIGDLTGDGLDDILVGVGSAYIDGADTDTRLVLLKNIGTDGFPRFEISDSDYLNFSQYSKSTYFFAPALGDLDSDGDLDLLVGDYNGFLSYCKNIAAAGQAASFEPVVRFYKNIDVTPNSVPLIADLNADGLSDILLGTRNGNFILFPNIGTKGNPDFASDFKKAPNNADFGKVRTFELPFNTGHSTPFIFRFNDKIILLSGSESGKTYVFEGNYNDINGTLIKTNRFATELGNSAGFFSAFAASTFSKKPGTPYCIISGNQRGGLQAYRVNLTQSGNSVGLKEDNKVTNFTFDAYPNPANQSVIIELPNHEKIYNLHLINILGQVVASAKTFDTYNFDVSHLPQGLYIVRAMQEGRVAQKKIKIVRF